MLAREKFIHVQRLALAGIEGSNALIELGTKLINPLDVIEKLTTDFLLIGVRQVRYRSYRLFQRLDHWYTIAQFLVVASIPGSGARRTVASDFTSPV